jgi:preprotein translocase subunit SecB
MPTKKITKPGMRSPVTSVVDRVELFAIGLDSLNANLDRSNYAEAYAEDNTKIARRIQSVYRVTDYSEEHFDVSATVYLRIEAKGFKDPILSIDATVTGHFHPKKSLSKNDAESFAHGEARLIFWPYFRQLVSDTTARMHVRTVTLPLVVS